MAEILKNKAIGAENEAVDTKTALMREIEESRSGVYTHALKREITWEGKTYGSLNFNFAALTGRDLIDIERELKALKLNTAARTFSADFQVRVAARACDAPIGVDMLEQLPFNDLNMILTKVQNFMIYAG